jgi:adenosylmethionine-8-amino-7-oxononanoate aminotransferase
VSGGSEATEAAIKLARQYFLERDGSTRKYKIISRWTSYHGNTLGALSVSGKAGLMKKYDPLLLKFPHIDSAYCYRCEFGLFPDTCDCPCAKSLEKAILREGSENIAGFIFEPVTGSASPGSYPKKEYYKIIREICDKYDILMIADEVMNGFGRTGANFGVDNFDVIPDIMCIAKGISSGYAPLGGIVVSDRIAGVFRNGTGKFTHGHTFSGNPLSCAVGCKALEILVRDRIVDNAREKGRLLLDLLKEELKDCPIVGDIRGLGLQLGIEFVKDKGTKAPFEKSISGKITKIGLKNGIVVYPGSGNVDSTKGDNILLTPPLIITEEQVYDITKKLKETFNEAANEILR